MASIPKYVDEDDISLTSTESEQYNSDTEFEVEKILAEKGSKNNKFYLISWLDYPIEKATWEPQKHVGPEILGTWNKRKQRQEEGKEERFDVDQWTNRVKKLENERADRKRRRAAKRKRVRKAELEALAAKNARKQQHADSDASSSEALEENEFVDYAGMRQKGAVKRKVSVRRSPLKTASKGPSIDELYDRVDKADAKIEEGSHRKKKSGKRTGRSSETNLAQHVTDPEEDVPLAKAKRSDSTARPLSASISGPSAQQLSVSRATSAAAKSSVTAQRSVAAKPAAASRQPTAGRTASSHSIDASRPPMPASIVSANSTDSNRGMNPPRGGLNIRAGKRATRGGSNVGPRNVFEAREAPKSERPNLLKNATNAVETKPFGNMRFRRLVTILNCFSTRQF
ncbi:hypothetical protein LZ554_002909 [Drepanopeziza brunnea f. sp. 'monogermtubi']|nr:hypothetical protein LZ554_002909 [Drepanopeziza brunnea f. sp. 'monogermtubi']